VIETINRVPVSDLASAKRALRDGRNLASYYYRGGRRYRDVHCPLNITGAFFKP
jgi:hypothetical protein